MVGSVPAAQEANFQQWPGSSREPLFFRCRCRCRFRFPAPLV